MILLANNFSLFILPKATSIRSPKTAKVTVDHWSTKSYGSRTPGKSLHLRLNTAIWSPYWMLWTHSAINDWSIYETSAFKVKKELWKNCQWGFDTHKPWGNTNFDQCIEIGNLQQDLALCISTVSWLHVRASSSLLIWQWYLISRFFTNTQTISLHKMQ